MTRYIVLSIILTLSCPLSASSGESGERKWKLVRDRQGIQVYRSHTDESRLKSIRAVTRMPLEDIRSFVATLEDYNDIPKWVHFCSNITKLNLNDPLFSKYYLETRLPWPVKDRHGVLDFNFSQAEDYSITVSFTESETPPPDKKGYIAVPEAHGFATLKTIPDSKEVEISWQLIVDPGGYVPAFLVNLITDDVSYFTLRKFKKQILKEKYKNPQSSPIKRRPWVLANTLIN